MSEAKPLPNNVPKCPKGLDAILYLLLIIFQPTAGILGCIKVGAIRVGLWTISTVNVQLLVGDFADRIFQCLFGMGTALYILIAKAPSRPTGYNYYAVLVLSAVNFLADHGAASYGIDRGLFWLRVSPLSELSALEFTLGGLYAAQA
jgi:hypothetical protein